MNIMEVTPTKITEAIDASVPSVVAPSALDQARRVKPMDIEPNMRGATRRMV